MLQCFVGLFEMHEHIAEAEQDLGQPVEIPYVFVGCRGPDGSLPGLRDRSPRRALALCTLRVSE